MKLSDFNSVISKAGGDDCVLAFLFEDGTRMIFKDYKFDRSINMDESSNVVIEERNLNGVKSLVFKDIEKLSTIVTMKDSNDRIRVNPMSF